jgi:DNA-binding MarR family transcriptional regulator
VSALDITGKFVDLYRHLGSGYGLVRLAVLEAAGSDQPLSRIAERLGITSAAVTSIVDALFFEGHVMRLIGKDRRTYTLVQTEKGQRFLRLAHDTVECPKVKPVK